MKRVLARVLVCAMAVSCMMISANAADVQSPLEQQWK